DRSGRASLLKIDVARVREQDAVAFFGMRGEPRPDLRRARMSGLEEAFALHHRSDASVPQPVGPGKTDMRFQTTFEYELSRSLDVEKKRRDRIVEPRDLETMGRQRAAAVDVFASKGVAAHM